MLSEQEELLRQERAQRVQELLEMRKHDKNLGVARQEVTDPLFEINRRAIEYVSLLPYKLDFLLLQAVQDFRTFYIVLQNKKLDTSKPVLILRGEQTKIYVDTEVTKEQIRLSLGVAMAKSATNEERDILVTKELQCFISK